MDRQSTHKEEVPGNVDVLSLPLEENANINGPIA